MQWKGESRKSNALDHTGFCVNNSQMNMVPSDLPLAPRRSTLDCMSPAWVNSGA
jgi:hypothetical protein